MLKVFAFLTKLPHLSDAAFATHWRDPHGVLTTRIPQFRRYAQNHRVGSISGLAAASFDGIATIWIDDMAAFAAANAHPDYAALDADGDEIYVRKALVWMIGTEMSIAPPPQDPALAPVKAMLLLKARSGGILEDASLAETVAAAPAMLPGLIGATASLPLRAGDGAFDAVVELAFADVPTAEAAWRAGGATLLDNIVADRAASRGLLAREERVIWPQPMREIA